MATKFGVQLKSTGAPGDASARETRRPGARLGGNTTKPISDLKAMFDKDGKGSSVPPNTHFGTDFSKKTTTSTTTTKTMLTKTKSTGNSAAPRGVGLNAGLSIEDQDAFSLLSQKLKETGIDGILPDENEEEEPVVAVAKVYGGTGSHAYQATVETKGKSSSDKSEDGTVTKTTVRSQLSHSLALMRIRPGSGKGERTLSRGSSFDDDTPLVPKTTASGGSEIKTVTESKSLFSVGAKRTEDATRSAARDRYIPGAPRGWKSPSTEASTTTATVSKSSYTPAYTAKTEVSKGSSVSTVSSKFTPSTVPSSATGQLTTGIGGGGDMKLALGARSGGSLGRQSSDDNSSSSSGVSPRGVPTGPGNTSLSAVGGRFSPRGSKQGEENSAIDLFLSKPRTATQTNSETSVTNRYSPNVSRTNNRNQTESGTNRSPLQGRTDVTKNRKSGLTANESKTPERKKTAWEQLSEDRKKFSRNRSSGSLSSDSDKGKKSPKPRGPEGKFKWMEKSRISLEEFKQQVNEGKSQRSSSSESSSSLPRADGQGVKARIERFASPDHTSSGQQFVGVKVKDNNAKNRKSGDTTTGIAPRTDFKKQTVRKINPQKFDDIKKGFEDKGKTGQESPTTRRKLKLEIKPSKRLLERRQSFENPKSVPRQGSVDRIIISPRESGKVLETLKSLNDLQAAARVEKYPVRRTQSLRKASVEDEDVSSGSLYEDVEVDHSPYYHDIHGVRLAEDGQSNEGDISSEADQGIYEIISDIRGKEGYSIRRNAVKKRKKQGDDDSLGCGESTDSKPETGTEADIDSDTDSSRSSGIYEPIDRDFDEGIFPSDSPDPDTVHIPPPVPKRTAKKKKKKEDKNGGQKGITAKFKKLYKGGNNSKSLENESTTSTYSTAPSAGVLNKIGGKLKNLKKTKSVPLTDQYGDNELVPVVKDDLDIEANPVCHSDSSELSAELEPPENIKALSMADENAPLPPKPELRPPPLPPRREPSQRASSGSASGGSPAPDGRTSPPLPPRKSRVSSNLDLNLVIPVAPGGTSASTGDLRKSGWPPNRESYLHGQHIRASSATDLPFMDESSGTDSSPSRPPRSPRSPANRDYGNTSHPRSHAPLEGVDSYICVDQPLDVLPDENYSLADEIQKELERRPVSSAYIKPHDLSTVPKPKSYVPFEDVIKYRPPNDEDEILYMDLSDDQVYGRVGDRYKSKLESESLYQFYNKDKISRASKRRAIYSSFDESDEDEYESEGERVYEDLNDIQEEVNQREKKEESPNKLSTLELFGKKGTVMRALWSEMPEVKASGVLDTISPHERKIQESMFEIITSEATYLKSLNVLISVFLMSPEFSSDMSERCVLTRQDRHVIFSNIGAIRDVSERFLADLEARWQKSVLLSDICDIIGKHASEHFECYVRYCSNQTFQDRMVTSLRKKAEFTEALKRLESSTECQGLPMISFLLLPMQRITRLPLLIDAIGHRVDPVKEKERHKSVSKAQQALMKVAKRCNEGAKKMQQTEQMCLIAQQLEFKIKEIPLISASRFLVKQGELTRAMGESGNRLFGKGKAGKQSLYLFLFSDILLITTKKKSNQYTVTDYAMRNAIHAEVVDNPEKVSRLLPLGVPSGCKNLFLLVMLENYEKKEMEMVFSCNSTSERARWVEAVTPVKVSDDQERIYEEWDCPQVQCIKKYLATEPDELTLDESDVINIYKKHDDGWYEGERLRDGERGWFPKDCTEEILNSHTRARNLRLRYRMMRASEAR